MQHQMQIDQLKVAVKATIQSGTGVSLAPMIWGPPGVGKSESIHQIAAEMPYTVPLNEEVTKVSKYLKENLYGKTFDKRPVKEVRLVLTTPTDLKGIPVYNTSENEAVWINTSLFPMDPNLLAAYEDEIVHLAGMIEKEGFNVELSARFHKLERKIEMGHHDQHSICFLDEITQAPQSVQGAAYQLILDRQLGTYVFPSTAFVVAAGNRMQDGAATNKMPTPLLSRFIHFHVSDPAIDDWLKWAAENDIEPDVMGFLKYQEEALFKFNPKTLTGSADSGDSTFPCPRTWKFVSDILKGPAGKDPAMENVLEAIIAGTVGNNAASEFSSWRELYRKLPQPEEVLDKGNFDIEFKDSKGNYDLSLEYAFCMNLARKLAIADETKSALDPARFVEFTIQRGNNFFEFFLRSKKAEFGVLAFAHLMGKKMLVVNKCEKYKKFAALINVGQSFTGSVSH